MKYISYISSLLVMFSLFWAVSCSEESDVPGNPEDILGRPVHTSLSIRTASSMPEENELIHSWWVAFVAPDGNVELIVSRALGSPVDEDNAEVTIPAGNYTVVGFANNIPEKNPDGSFTYHNGSQELIFREGNLSPVMSANASEFRFADTAPETWHTDTLIPMSALQKVKVTGKNNEQIFIELVRLVAKIELSVENVGKRDITINSIRFGGFKSDSVFLFPNYASLDGAPVLPSPESMIDVTRIFPHMKLAPGEVGKDLFYTRESSALNSPNSVYTVFVSVTHHAGFGWNETTDEVSALLTDIGYVNRNDHVIIPLMISDYIIGIEANFYPPIGGYPAVVTEAGNGNYYAKFGSMGVFTIRPHVRKAVAVDDPDFGELSNTFLNMEITSVEGDDIFIQKPVLDVNHDIIGQLGASKGKSKVTLRFKMPQKDGSVLNYVRTIVIIRE